MSRPAEPPAWLREALTNLAQAQVRSEERFAAMQAQLAQQGELLAHLAAGHEQTTALLAQHGERLDRLDALLAQQSELLARQDERLGRIATQLDEQGALLTQQGGQLERIEPQLDDRADQIEAVAGWVWETRVRDRAASYLTDVADHVQVLTPVERDRLLDPAVAAGSLTREEARDVRRADLVCRVSDPVRGEQRVLIAEVAARVTLQDVARAAAFAGLLARLGTPVLAVVLGQRIDHDAQTAANAAGVRVLLSTDRRAAAAVPAAAPSYEPVALPSPTAMP